MLAASFVLAACDSDHDEPAVCPGDPEIESVTLPSELGAGDVFEAAFEVHNFEFSMEGDHHDLQPSDGNHQFRAGELGGSESGCIVGHVHLYVDDLMTNPIAQLTFPEAEVALPADTEPGAHKWIARLHSADHKIIEPQIIAEQDFTVQ